MTAPAGDCRSLCGDGPGGSRCTSGPAIGVWTFLVLHVTHCLSCSPETEHGAEPICRAPALGAHTASFDRQDGEPRMKFLVSFQIDGSTQCRYAVLLVLVD